MAKPKLGKKIDALTDQLRALYQEGFDWYDDHSDKWKESDAGQEYESRLDELSNAIDALEQLPYEDF